MAVFRELPEAEVLKILENYTDELSPDAKKNEAFYRHQVCRNCRGTSFSRQSVVGHAFQGDSLVARAVLRCNACNLQFDPFSGIELEPPDPVPDIVIVDPKTPR